MESERVSPVVLVLILTLAFRVLVDFAIRAISVDACEIVLVAWALGFAASAAMPTCPSSETW